MKFIDEAMLVEIASRAATAAYAPYSKFHVGAAVHCYDGCSKVFNGANVENASYSLTICAERVAIFKTVNAGKQQDAMKIVIVTNGEEPSPPCGACLQVMAEFFKPQLEIISYATKTETIKRWRLKDLLPKSFKP